MYIETCMRRSGDTMLNACMDRKEEEEEAMKQQADPSPAPPPATKYRGVRMRKWGKWVAEARYPNSRERLWLGSYPSAKMAAMAYDAAVYCLRGPGEALNFPDHPPNIPSADRLSRYEILEAAGRHAEQARLLEQESSSAAGPSAGESNSGLAEAASATLPGEPLQDLFEPESGGGGEWAGVEDEDFWAGGGDVGGGNDDDSDGDMFGVFPLWDFQFPK